MEERVKRSIPAGAVDDLITRQLPIRLDTVLQAVQLPTSITDLDTSLADMDGNTLTLEEGENNEVM